MEDFWTRIRKLITLKGLKQYDLEQRLGLKPAFISQSTIRGTIPRANVALQLADFFGVTVRWLVTGVDESSIDPKYVTVIANKSIMEMAFELTHCTEDCIIAVEHIISYDQKYGQKR